MVIQFFHTCLVNEVFPGVGLAAVRVLERLGFEVNVPLEQTCCGQPAFNGGFHQDARSVARHTLKVLHATDGPIVVPSGSCADMIVHQYPLLFNKDAEMLTVARAVAPRTWEFSQFVAEHRPSGESLGSLNARVAYHPSCHLLRGIGVRTQPLDLLASIDGVALATVPDGEECCGFGGLFSIKHPEISGSMMDRKLSNIAGSGAERLVSCDLGCLMHMAGGLHRRRNTMVVQHLAEIIDEALR